MSNAITPVNTLVAPETMEQIIARLTAENERLKANKSSHGGLKVSEKGAVSVYGLGRFPITLYKSQWLKLLGMAESIQAFIVTNQALLKEKE